MKPARFNFADNTMIAMTDREYNAMRRQYPFEGEPAAKSVKTSLTLLGMSAVLVFGLVWIMTVTP